MAAAIESGSSRRESPSVVASLRQTLDKPLTSYHLVLGVTGLLLALGLLMVLSASSVISLRELGSSYAIFERQAMWVAVGLPAAWAASRLPIRLVRFAAWPALLISTLLVAATYVPGVGVSVNDNRNGTSVGGPFLVQSSECAKLALVLWSADVYARK
ncbi:MAG: FtsW/RodA/SpoVE family cell cycle protein, partial [Nocardioidaceae bacterium]